MDIYAVLANLVAAARPYAADPAVDEALDAAQRVLLASPGAPDHERRLVVPAAGACCSYLDCLAPADDVACGHPDLPGGHGCGVYCRTHTDVVSDEGNPEYTQVCPNCGCWTPVN